jgi:hypothetical protein
MWNFIISLIYHWSRRNYLAAVRTQQGPNQFWA